MYLRPKMEYTIALPDYKHKKYFVAFFETDSTPVLEVKDIKDPDTHHR